MQPNVAKMELVLHSVREIVPKIEATSKYVERIWCNAATMSLPITMNIMALKLERLDSAFTQRRIEATGSHLEKGKRIAGTLHTWLLWRFPLAAAKGEGARVTAAVAKIVRNFELR